MMAQLYDVDVRTLNYHLKKLFADSELEEDSVIQNFRITAADGKTYDTKHYNLSAIIAVGYKVNSERAVQFRKWATRVIYLRCADTDSHCEISRESGAFSQAERPPGPFLRPASRKIPSCGRLGAPAGAQEPIVRQCCQGRGLALHWARSVLKPTET